MAKKVNKALMKKVRPDAALASIIGATPLSRGQVTAKLWNYIKRNGLNDGRSIKLDARMKSSRIWGSKSCIDMTEVGKAQKHVC